MYPFADSNRQEETAMRMTDLIVKKRNGLALSEEEIYEMINRYTDGTIPDYQMSAMMMAIYFRGMTEEETLALTLAMEKAASAWICPA